MWQSWPILRMSTVMGACTDMGQTLCDTHVDCGSVHSLLSCTMGFSYLAHIHHNGYMLRIMICINVQSLSHDFTCHRGASSHGLEHVLLWCCACCSQWRVLTGFHNTEVAHGVWKPMRQIRACTETIPALSLSLRRDQAGVGGLFLSSHITTRLCGRALSQG